MAQRRRSPGHHQWQPEDRCPGRRHRGLDAGAQRDTCPDAGSESRPGARSAGSVRVDLAGADHPRCRDRGDRRPSSSHVGAKPPIPRRPPTSDATPPTRRDSRGPDDGDRATDAATPPEATDARTRATGRLRRVRRPTRPGRHDHRAVPGARSGRLPRPRHDGLGDGGQPRPRRVRGHRLEPDARPRRGPRGPGRHDRRDPGGSRRRCRDRGHLRLGHAGRRGGPVRPRRRRRRCAARAPSSSIARRSRRRGAGTSPSGWRSATCRWSTRRSRAAARAPRTRR